MPALWQWLKRTGLERFELTRGEQAWFLDGTIVTLGERGPADVHYRIACDTAWQTRTADITLADDRGLHRLQIVATDGTWFVNGDPAPQLDGCIDIDLGWSPSTNTLPIRRLNLEIGARSAPLNMAWVRFPELTVEVLAQSYERIAERQYIYRSRDGGFQAVLDVDDDGVVIHYEAIWTRVH